MQPIIRGHHLLCVHSFQGMGYSPEFIKKMSELVNDIRNEEITFPIKVVIDLDETCFACPRKGDGFCNAGKDSDIRVKGMDRKVIHHLGLKADGTYDKKQLVRLTAEKVEPDDLDVLCAGCSWLSYGVCKQGIENLKQKVETAH